ncbi:MAG: lysozyme [Citrobacter sp.]|jgi:GH24 family phage-related lysozyme (muramidase)|uniref:Lysozyme n=1 Tax=Citrobacter tructae TaxID=2562449 RepID=A0ABX5T6P8_9ENTR|nr:lysozyme [Citrobacter tructae]QBX82162.1 lysozyme [Citrobacter tructae]
MYRHSSHFTPACIAFIKQGQGLSLEKYQDERGVWVIGYGHEITASETFNSHISVAQAETLLLTDLSACEELIHTKFPQLEDLFQLEALIAWIFSVGITQFCASGMWPAHISQPEML